MLRKGLRLGSMLLVCFLFQSARGEQGENKPKPPHKPGGNNGNKPNDAVAAITKGIKSNDNFQVQQAVEAAVKILRDEKTAKSAIDEMQGWLTALLKQKRLDEIEELSLTAICIQPASLSLIENCQKIRIRAYLVAGKPKEALALGKGLYNVCSMTGTSNAIDLISECIYEVYSEQNPGDMIKKFKTEQLEGATPPEKDAVPKKSSFLAAIELGRKTYAAAIENCDLNPDGFAGLQGKGNLLLLSDMAKEAKKAFEKAYTLAADKNLAPASEAVARAMRAEDGTVGRANSWILSLRSSDGGQ